MTRIVSASVVGALPRQVARGAAIAREWFKNAIGDTALVYDRITGENAATPIDHTGAPNGAPLGMPLVCQQIDRNITVDTGIADRVYILAVPIYVPTGNDGYTWLVEVDISDGGATGKNGVGGAPASDNNVGMTVEVRDTSWTLDQDPIAMVEGDDVTLITSGTGHVRMVASVQLGQGHQYLAVTRMGLGSDTRARLFSWRVYPVIPLTGSAGFPSTPSAALGQVYTGRATLTPSTWIDFYTDEIQSGTTDMLDSPPMDGWKLTQSAKNQSALWEFITGARVPGNDDYECSTVRKSDLTVFANEGEIELPIFSVALGSVFFDRSGKSPQSDITGGWYRVPTTQAGTLNIARTLCALPTYDEASSSMKCRVLAQEYAAGGTMTRWEVRINNGTTGTSTGWVALSSIGGDMWGAEITAVPFDGGVANRLTLQAQNTAGGATVNDKVAFVGWSMAHIP